jgi:hypothetical protein
VDWVIFEDPRPTSQPLRRHHPRADSVRGGSLAVPGAGSTAARHGAEAQRSQRDGPPPIRLHDLRHGSARPTRSPPASRSRSSATDLGHRDTRITENLNTSVLPELKQAAANAVAATIPTDTAVSTGRSHRVLTTGRRRTSQPRAPPEMPAIRR